MPGYYLPETIRFAQATLADGSRAIVGWTVKWLPVQNVITSMLDFSGAELSA